jgi:hypothetical protein
VRRARAVLHGAHPRGRQRCAGTLSKVRAVASLLLCTLAAGCTVVGHERVEGWPELEIVEHRVPHRVMRDRCMPYAALLVSPEACAEFDFANRKCHIWFSSDFPPPQAFVEHEHLHCRGFDHIGQKGMDQALRSYLNVQKTASVSGR